MPFKQTLLSDLTRLIANTLRNKPTAASWLSAEVREKWTPDEDKESAAGKVQKAANTDRCCIPGAASSSAAGLDLWRDIKQNYMMHTARVRTGPLRVADEVACAAAAGGVEAGSGCTKCDALLLSGDKRHTGTSADNRFMHIHGGGSEVLYTLCNRYATCLVVVQTMDDLQHPPSCTQASYRI